MSRPQDAEPADRAGVHIDTLEAAEPADAPRERDGATPTRSSTDPWLLSYDGFDPDHEGHREALTVLGNGYLATRGARPESSDDGAHYPGTYLAGVYNRLDASIHGHRLEEEQVINVPNWRLLDVRIGQGPWWSSGLLAVSDERHVLDLRRGVLTRRATLSSDDGQRLEVVQESIVSMHDPHLAALETTFTPLGWSGTISVRSGIDATVSNTNVRWAVDRSAHHLLAPEFVRVDPETMLCQVRTSSSRIGVALAVRTRISGAVSADSDGTVDGRYRRQADLDVRAGRPATVTKTVAFATSRDPAMASPGSGALTQLVRGPDGVEGLRAAHEAAWRRLWQRFAVTVDADPKSQMILNLHLFHLMQTLSHHSAALDAGVPARGLHGEGYRGHVFWDELFVLPVVGLRAPAVGAALLEYRWRRLDAARDAARDAGLNGALFPWQSGSDGTEETPDELYNVRSSEWMPDNSHLQRHVGLAVAYNAWQHYQMTGNQSWLSERGAELIIEVTRLFASLATYDPVEDRFHIAGVMGPDEYHDSHPGSVEAGLRDNAYTNVLLSWVCRRAADALSVLARRPCDDLLDRLSVTTEEQRVWSHMARRLAVPFHADGIISQFDGYEALQELDWARYRSTYGNIGRLDLILAAENDTTNRYKLSKQADVLMLVHLFGLESLQELLHRIGYSVPEHDLRRTVEYYLARTSNGSTLSHVVHASALANIDETQAWAALQEALVADLDDTQGGTTREGIHLGAMAGTADIPIRAFAGLRTGADMLTFAPRLPPAVRHLQFQVQYRGQMIDVSLTRDRLRLHLHPCGKPPVNVRCRGTVVPMRGGETRDFALDASA